MINGNWLWNILVGNITITYFPHVMYDLIDGWVSIDDMFIK